MKNSKFFLQWIILLIFLACTSCGGSSGGGGGISGTGAGIVGITTLIIVSGIGNSGNESTYFDDDTFTSYVFPDPGASLVGGEGGGDPDSRKCNDNDNSLSPPNYLRGMWWNEATASIFSVRNSYAFFEQLDDTIFDTRSYYLSNEVLTDVEYLFSLTSRDCLRVTNITIVKNGTDSIVLNTSGEFQHSLQLDRRLASSFIMPPDWILGSWKYQSESGNVVIRDFSNNSISVGNNIETPIEYTSFLTSPTAIFSNLKKNDTIYEYRFIAENKNNEAFTFRESFESETENTIIYSTTNNFESHQYRMTRVER